MKAYKLHIHPVTISMTYPVKKYMTLLPYSHVNIEVSYAESLPTTKHYYLCLSASDSSQKDLLFDLEDSYI
jgi:hypothetical protein